MSHGGRHPGPPYPPDPPVVPEGYLPARIRPQRPGPDEGQVSLPHLFILCFEIQSVIPAPAAQIPPRRRCSVRHLQVCLAALCLLVGVMGFHSTMIICSRQRARTQAAKESVTDRAWNVFDLHHESVILQHHSSPLTDRCVFCGCLSCRDVIIV